MLNDAVSSIDNNEVQDEVFEEIIEDDTIYGFEDIPKIPDNLGVAQVKVRIPVRILKKFYKYSTESWNIPVPWLDHVSTLLADYNSKFDEQHHAASLIFDGRKPRKDVLVKLNIIANIIESEDSFPKIHRETIPKIVRSALAHPDVRTLKKYIKCVKDYANTATYPPDIYLNFEKFRKAITINLEASS